METRVKSQSAPRPHDNEAVALSKLTSHEFDNMSFGDKTKVIDAVVRRPNLHQKFICSRIIHLESQQQLLQRLASRDAGGGTLCVRRANMLSIAVRLARPDVMLRFAEQGGFGMLGILMFTCKDSLAPLSPLTTDDVVRIMNNAKNISRRPYIMAPPHKKVYREMAAALARLSSRSVIVELQRAFIEEALRRGVLDCAALGSGGR